MASNAKNLSELLNQDSTIAVADVADDAITGAKLANDIAISTTGNIATTGSGTLSVAGNTTLSGTAAITGLITASAGVAIGGTGSANTLDDYEEGTWSASIGASSSGSFTTSVESATYTKVGRIVTAIASLNTTGESSPTGYITIANLPFTPASGHVGRSPVCLYFDGMESGNYVADMVGLTIGGDTTIRIYLGDANTAQGDSAQAIDGSTYILLNVTYNT